MMHIKNNLFLILILLFGAVLRFYHLNWDQNEHLHPDERFLTMVTQAVSWPDSVTRYFDSASSPLNPHNVGYPFYVYGTTPVIIVKAASDLLGMDSYNGITLVGRAVSAGLDSAVILILYFIVSVSFKSKKAGLLSALFYSSFVLPIQLSHFYAVDSFLVFFLVAVYLCFVLLYNSLVFRKQLFLTVVAGIIFGLAIASKITALLFSPILFVGFVLLYYRLKNFHRVFLLGLVFGLVSLFSVRINEPYLFSGPIGLNQKVVENLKTLKSYEDPSGWFPPAVQWLRAKPLVFPLENMIYWGLGPFLSLILLVSLVSALRQVRRQPTLILPVLWIVGLFIYQGFQFAKPMRYFYPVYPFFALVAGVVFSRYWPKHQHIGTRLIFVFLVIIWSVAFTGIYSRPHSRVQASEWINTHLPPGSILSCEYWDDCLPLGGTGQFKFVELHLYDPDTYLKWQTLLPQLSSVDYLILTSNRLYGSIMTVPEKYPYTSMFYDELFSGRLGFIPIAQFSSRPNLPVPGLKVCITPPLINYGQAAFKIQACDLPGISFVDDYSDESFTVYDHPKVIIFKKVTNQNLQTFVNKI